MEQINRARAIINSNLSLTVVSFSVEIIEATPFSLSLFQLNKKRDSCRNGYNWSTSGTVLSERLLNSASGQECSQLSPTVFSCRIFSFNFRYYTFTILYPFLAMLCCLINPFLAILCCLINPFLAILCCLTLSWLYYVVLNPFLTVVSQVQRTGVGGSSVRG